MFFFRKNKKEIKKTEDLLIEKGRKFQEIFNQSAMGEAVIDLSGTYLEVNERFCEITGYPKNEIIGKNLSEVTFPDDIKKTKAVLRDIILKKIPFGKLEKRYLCKDGHIVWGLLNITLVCDENCKPGYFFGQIQDITEFKEKEKKLRESELKYSTVVEKGNDGIILVQDFLIKFANSKMLDLTGYAMEEIQDKEFLSFVSSDYVNLIKENYIKRLAGEKTKINYKVEIIKKNGQKLPVEISGSVINYQGRPADLAFLRDITEREKAEEELRSQKALLDSVIRSIDEALIVIDIEGKIVFYNDQFKTLWNIPKKIIEAKDDKKLVEHIASKLSDTKMLLEKIKYLNVHLEEESNDLVYLKDKRILGVHSFPHKIDKKNVGRIWSFLDITKDKKIDKAKTEFVSLASHQLRAPATAVKWYSEMLLDKKTGELNNEQLSYLKEIYHGNERMIRLINNLLNISKIELGEVSVNRELVNIKKLLRSVIKEQENDILRKGHKVTIKQSVGFPDVFTDSVLLRIIFQNFLSNAIKYTPDGGKIICNLKKDNSKFLFSIKDDGAGIPKKEQKRIFEKLFRASNALEIDKNGNGLGLYITKQIANTLGGKIWFESELGNGTTFYLELPRENKG